MHRDTSSQDKAPKPIEVDAAREDIKLAEANPLVQDDADESNDGTSQDAVADLMLGDYVQRFNIIPRCVVRIDRRFFEYDLTMVVELRSLASPRTRMCLLRPYLFLPADRSSAIRAWSAVLHRGLPVSRGAGLYKCRFLYLCITYTRT